MPSLGTLSHKWLRCKCRHGGDSKQISARYTELKETNSIFRPWSCRLEWNCMLWWSKNKSFLVRDLLQYTESASSWKGQPRTRMLRQSWPCSNWFRSGKRNHTCPQRRKSTWRSNDWQRQIRWLLCTRTFHIESWRSLLILIIWLWDECRNTCFLPNTAEGYFACLDSVILLWYKRIVTLSELSRILTMLSSNSPRWQVLLADSYTTYWHPSIMHTPSQRFKSWIPFIVFLLINRSYWDQIKITHANNQPDVSRPVSWHNVIHIHQVGSRQSLQLS